MDQKTEIEILNQIGIDVVLCEKSYHIKPLPLGKDIQWRAKLSECLSKCLDKLQKSGIDTTKDFEISDHLAQLLPMILSDSLDDFIELVFLYSPELTKDKTQILENVDLDDFVIVGSEIFKLAGGRVKKTLKNSEKILSSMFGTLTQ